MFAQAVKLASKITSPHSHPSLFKYNLVVPSCILHHHVPVCSYTSALTTYDPNPNCQQHHPFRRLFCSETAKNNNHEKRNTKVNFSLSDSESDSDSVNDNKQQDESKREIDKSKLPPPYNPFAKNDSGINDHDDPKDLQYTFHKMRSEGGLIDYAVKMFDALSKDGLTHEALQLFSQIKDKGHMPDVVAYTAVMEAYANAGGGGQSKEVLKVFMRMLASGVAPNAYTYTVLVKGLASDGRLEDAGKYVLEMMEKGMRPNVGAYVALFEGFVREEKVEYGREFLLKMKAKGFVPNEKAVREVLKNKRGVVFRTVINVLFDK